VSSWLDPKDYAVRSAVVSGAWGRTPHTEHGNPLPPDGEIDAIAEALAAASDILTRATAFAIHPAMQVVEDFTAHPRVTRLFPSFGPVRDVVSVSIDGFPADPPILGWTSFGHAIHFAPTPNVELRTWLLSFCAPSYHDVEHLRVTYNASSTVNAAARRAVLALAHEYWVDTIDCADCGECKLPDRTTSVQRAGLSYQLADPQEPDQVTLTGLPSVDRWVRMMNPYNSTRRPGVWTPDSPPPATRSVHAAYPVYGSGIGYASGAALNVVAGSGQ
jgi:hypothetical protein